MAPIENIVNTDTTGTLDLREITCVKSHEFSRVSACDPSKTLQTPMHGITGTFGLHGDGSLEATPTPRPIPTPAPTLVLWVLLLEIISTDNPQVGLFQVAVPHLKRCDVVVHAAILLNIAAVGQAVFGSSP